MRVGVVGLGKLGLPLAVTLQRAGHSVIGVDFHSRISRLQNGRLGFWEPGITQESIDQLQLTTSYHTLISHYQPSLIFLCVNTPTGDDGNMDLSQVFNACRSIHQVDPNSVVVVNSTVMPGTCRELQDRFSGLHVISNPVWIAIGSVIKDLESPPNMVIGCDGCSHRDLDFGCGCDRLEYLWSKIATIDLSQYMRTDTKTAEFIKLAHNAWCCIKMVWMGSIGDRASELGIDVDDLSDFMAHGGERPGKFWRYGPSFGGPCFPRDLKFWNQESGDELGSIVSRLNRVRLYKLAYLITRSIPDNGRVCILGHSYKFGVEIDEASTSLDLAAILTSNGHQVELINAEGQVPANIGICVIMHRELAGLVPADVPYIDVWDWRSL